MTTTDDAALDNDEPDDESENLPPLEQKYKKQMRQIVTQKLDLPVSALLSMLKDQIQLKPDFQRRDRWTESQQSRLIESLIMNVPIPPVFLGEDEYGHYVVLDGRQRLTAVTKFLNNEFKLCDLDVWDELNGKTFQDLVKRDFDRYLIRRFIPAIAILKESSSIVKYDVFDRLNTGGVKANDMEIRNAIYRGEFTELLHELSRTKSFCSLWNIPVDLIEAEQNKLYQQMEDLVLVLRFFALSDYESMTVRFKDHLSEFMESRNSAYRVDQSLRASDRAHFLNASENCLKIFGNEDAFRRPNGTGSKSFPLSDAIMIALAGIPTETVDTLRAEKIKSEINILFENQAFLKSFGTGTNGRGAIRTRISLATEAVRRAVA